MMKRSNSRTNPGDLVDRISALPESILSLILSFIPTKNSVATSVLSKRWKSLWKAVHNLDFRVDFFRYVSELENMKFVYFVNHVLLLHDGGFLNSFSLVWKPTCMPFHVNSWISAAIARNIQNLYLCIDRYDRPFEIPSCVFGCSTLKYMEFDGKMFVSDSVVVSVSLPKLERLTLFSVYFLSDVTFQKLISGCPVLNFLSITHYNTQTEYAYTFNVSSTSLRDFILEMESEPEFGCSLELNTPSLVYLQLLGYVPNIIVRESPISLVEAEFSIKISEYELSDASFCNSLVEAIRALNCAKSLTLSENVLSALSRATIGLSTKFKRLTELSTWADCCYCSSIQDFIQSSDCLQVLTVYNKELMLLDLGNDDHIHSHSNWTTPVEIPRCLSNSLKTVEIDGYRGLDYERDMIRYMLRHGSALEVMTINWNWHGIKLELVDEIRDFLVPRKSLACRVNFLSDMEDISLGGLQG